MRSALAWHKAPTGGFLPPECDSPALPLQGPAVNPAAQRRDKEMQSRTQSAPLGSPGAWAPPPAHLYSPKVSSFMGRASESTWVSSLSFTADTEWAQLLTLPHHPARPQAHGPSPSHTQRRQLPSGHLPAAPSTPMLSCPGSGTEREWGHSRDVPEYLPPLLRLMKHRMSKTRSRTTMALTKPMNQPSVAKPVGGSLTRPGEGRGGQRLRPRPGLNAGGPQGHCSCRTWACPISPRPWARASL